MSNVKVYEYSGTTVNLDINKRAELLAYDTDKTSFIFYDADITLRHILTLDDNYNIITNGATGIGNIIFKDGANISLGSGKATLTFNDETTDDLTLTNARMAIGAVTPDSLLHIWDSSAGTVAALAGTLLTLEVGSDHADSANYISFLSAVPNEGYTSAMGLIMGLDGDNDICKIVYNNVGGANSYLDFILSGTRKVSINTVGMNIGDYPSDSDSLLHICKANAGTVAAYSDTLLTIENNNHAYISFLTPANMAQGIIFGDADSNFRGWIIYDHNDDTLEIMAGAAGGLEISATAVTLYAGINLFPNVNGNGTLGIFHGSTLPGGFEGAMAVDHDETTNGTFWIYHNGAWRKVIDLP